MNGRYAHIVRAILARPWAIDPDSLAWAAICDVLALRASGGTLSDAEIAARIEAAANGLRAGGTRAKAVAVIPIYGVISPRMATMSRMSGGTAADAIAADFRAALADPEIDGIVFDVDSPGGNVEGIAELAGEIREARGQGKPIAAVANHMAASAAYWPITGVDELVATPSASVGSIGVFAAHQDVSAAMEQKGIRTTFVYAGKHKVDGNEYEPLGDEARAAIQADVDTYYGMFTADVAKGRGVSVEAVRNGFGEGRTVLAKAALDLGMVDRIDTLENTIRRVARGAIGTSPKAVALGFDMTRAAPDDDTPDALASGRPFSERLALASALATDLAEQARKRAELRAAEGRLLSEATRTELRGLSDQLRAIAEGEDAEPVDEPEPEPEPEPTPAQPIALRRVDLEIHEAALRRGYRLPATVN